MPIQILGKAQTTLMGIEKNDGKLANRSSGISLRGPDDQLPGHRKGGWKNPTWGDKLDCLSMVIQNVVPQATHIHTSYLSNFSTGKTFGYILSTWNVHFFAKMSNLTTGMYVLSTKGTISPYCRIGSPHTLFTTNMVCLHHLFEEPTSILMTWKCNFKGCIKRTLTCVVTFDYLFVCAIDL